MVSSPRQESPRLHDERLHALTHVLLLEPHHGGSHRAVARGLARHSECEITLAALPARNWKWRLRAAGLVFAARHARDLSRFDLIFASSLQNLADFLALVSNGTARRQTLPPVILYMHESQLAYPPARRSRTGTGASGGGRAGAGAAEGGRRPDVTPASGGPPRDWGLLFADLSSTLAADVVLFNSAHHRNAFLDGVRQLLSLLPDAAPRGVVALLRRKSRILYPGVNLSDVPPPRPRRKKDAAPLILWNHRWEFDKNPGEFFSALHAAEERGARFRLALLGETARVVPKVFLAARERFRERLARYGRVASRRDYVRWLVRADILVSTSEHENFGIAWLEGMAAGAYPLLPDREAYPELLPRALHAEHLYRGREDLVRRLVALTGRPEMIEAGRDERAAAARRFDWSERIDDFDTLFRETLQRRASERQSPRRSPARLGTSLRARGRTD